jgi:hypothetical protein
MPHEVTMKAYKLKDFAKQARKNKISDKELCHAVARAEKGLIDGPIGKFLIKQRVGRSGDYRTIIVHVEGEKAIFVHMFPKNAQANLTSKEERTYREAAKVLSEIGGQHIATLISAGEWIEIDYENHQEDVSE